MRRILLLVVLVLLVLITFALPTRTYKTLMTTWNQLKTDSEKLVERADAFNKKNTEDFEKKIEDVVDAYGEMNLQKEAYQDQVEKIKNDKVNYNLKTYNIQYLWMEIGKFATDENVYLKMDVNESETANSLNSSYRMCDIVFQGYGLYSELNSFISKIEDFKDGPLGFQIDSFKLQPIPEDELKQLKKESEYWNSFTKEVETTLLKLTFNVLEIPVGTDDLTKLSDELNKEYQDANAKKKK